MVFVTLMMDSIHNKVYYCCVSRGSKIIHAYSSGDPNLENLAALCLESIPPYHRWYFETIAKKTFGFLIEDGYVYFTIVDENVGTSEVLQFLEHVRDELNKVAKKSSRGSFSTMSSSSIQDQLVPVIRNLIMSLENVSKRSSNWTNEFTLPIHDNLSPSPSNANAQLEAATSTKAPLLGKFNKKAKDHAIGTRDVEFGEHRRSTDKGVSIDSIAVTSDSANQDGAGSSISLQKDISSMRIRSGSQNIRKKWWRQVRIVLAIDVAVCIILFVVWLLICGGLDCIR